MNIDREQIEAPDDESDDDSLQGILFETSPYQNVNAIVQHDERAIYFYLSGDENFGTRACWLRNLQESPYVISKDDLAAGIPPLMPRTHCRSVQGSELPDPESLHVVWFEEGNAAALYEDDSLVAVIPPWSGVDGFHGYSLECTAESPIAWPLVEQPSLIQRIERAREFWQSCTSEKEHPFAVLQPLLLDLYRQQFGDDEKYFTLDGGQFPPRGAVLYRGRESSTLLSVGMSLRPQPNVEMSVEHPKESRRIELGISLPSDITESKLQPLLEQFSGLVAWPWNGFTWFGAGHTCELESLVALLGSTNVEFVAEKKKEPTLAKRMPAFRDDPINLLWLSPSSE